jgi:hypothetical protein
MFRMPSVLPRTGNSFNDYHLPSLPIVVRLIRTPGCLDGLPRHYSSVDRLAVSGRRPKTLWLCLPSCAILPSGREKRIGEKSDKFEVRGGVLRRGRRIGAIAAGLLALGSVAGAQVWRADQGDGTYQNPVLFADYPDPDIIRVGQDFYFVSTTFANVPGITILHSRDLVNWRIAGHVLQRLDGDRRFDLANGDMYRRGFFAASLRHHRGQFFLAVTPVGMNTRLYRTASVTGPWTLSELDRQAFDPGLFFDDNGTGYMATSAGSDGTITLLTLNKGYSAVASSRVIHFNKGAEGSKLIKRAGWYYLFNAIPNRLGLSVSRARRLTGPWETRPQIDDTSGGHQGALVDLPGGGWYGFVMVDAGATGRMTNISPVFWQDDWPVWGTPDAPNRPAPTISTRPRWVCNGSGTTIPTTRVGR